MTNKEIKFRRGNNDERPISIRQLCAKWQFLLSIYYGSFACLVNESEICHYRFLLFPIFALFVGICFSCFSCTKRYIKHSSQPPFLQKKMFCSIKKVAKNNKYKSILVKNFWAFYEPFPSFHLGCFVFLCWNMSSTLFYFPLIWRFWCPFCCLSLFWDFWNLKYEKRKKKKND